MATLSDFGTPVDRHKFFFQYVTTPTADTPGTTILLHFDNKRYLFGRVSEGTQRACTERGVSLKKARNIFLTGETTWQNNGGLLGMLLTVSDVAAETSEEEKQLLGNINIHGGPKIWHTVACARRFIFRTGMPLRVLEASPDVWKASQEPHFYDENTLIWALPIQKSYDRDSASFKPMVRSASPTTILREQNLRRQTVIDMFDSDWRKDRLYEAVFREVSLPAMVWVRDRATKDLQATFCTQLSDAPHIAPDQKVYVRMPWPAALVTELPPADNLPSSVAMSYFVKGRPQRGTFVAQKAKELGLKPGPKFGILASGKPVTLDDGRVVNPEDVMDPILPGYGMAVLDIPDVRYLPDLLRKLKALQEEQVLIDVHAFLWILGSGVLESPEFSEFTADFPNIKHVLSSPDDCPNQISMDSTAASSARLAYIRPATFQIPKHENTAKRRVKYKDNYLQAQRAMTLQVAPKFEVNTREVPPVFDVAKTLAGLSVDTKELKPSPSSSDAASTGKYDDISITTLGTGSAVPSKYRNVSANLLHIPTLGYFIFDAGENTIGQLKRIYDEQELDDLLCNLHMIWISHLHADHHLGTVSLLAARKSAVARRQALGNSVSDKLYLVSERNMADYLEDYKSVEDLDVILLRCLNSELTSVSGQPVQLERTTLPISELNTTRVSHCHGAQAISVKFSNGFKLSYSGDCRPSASFAEIGRDSDVLIHEATFDDGMEGDAMAKKHCTIGEALGVANAMKAKNVILTHFSQRYQKLPTLTDVKFPGELKFEEGDDASDPPGQLEDAEIDVVNGQSANGSSRDVLNSVESGNPPPALRKHTSLQAAAEDLHVCIAFDLMRVTIPQIKDMYKYYPAIESMFEHEQAKSDEKRGANRAANEAVIEARERKIAEKRKQGEGKQQKSKKSAKGENGSSSGRPNIVERTSPRNQESHQDSSLGQDKLSKSLHMKSPTGTRSLRDKSPIMEETSRKRPRLEPGTR